MLTGIRELDMETLKNLYRFSIRTGGNIMIFGPAGIGKTEGAQQAVVEEQCESIYCNLSVLEAPDIMGLPMINRETKMTEYATPWFLPLKGTRKGKCVLIVDEIDKAKPELQNPMLELFQFRTINGRPTDIGAIIATGNLPDENAFSLPVSHALTNRCGIYRVMPAFEPWQQWATEAGVNGLVVGYLSKNQDFLLKPPPAGDDTAYCHPSPRAWVAAARDLDAVMKESVEYQTLLVSGRVGTAAAASFEVWLQHYRFIAPMIDALIHEGKKPNIANMTVDRVMVCAIAACNEISALGRDVPADEKGRRDARMLKVTQHVFGWLKEIPSDFAIGAAKNALSMKLIQDWKLTRIPELMKVFVEIRKSLVD